MFKIACIFAFVVFAAASKDELGHSHFTVTHFGHITEHKDKDEHKSDIAEHDFGSHGEYNFGKHEDEGLYAGHDFKFDDHHEDHHEIHHDHHEEHKEDHHDYHHEPKYSYDYGVHDPHTGDNKNAWETRHGDTVKGGYTLHEADGTQRVVEYTADKHSGFNAIVKRIGHAKHPAIYSKHSHESEGHKSEEYGHEIEHKYEHEYEHEHEKEHKHEHGATSYNNFYLHSAKH